MNTDADLSEIREMVGHLARGCLSGRSHDPTFYEHAIDAALDRVRGALREQERLPKDIEPFLMVPSDTYPQHVERLGEVRERLRATLAAARSGRNE